MVTSLSVVALVATLLLLWMARAARTAASTPSEAPKAVDRPAPAPAPARAKALALPESDPIAAALKGSAPSIAIVTDARSSTHLDALAIEALDTRGSGSGSEEDDEDITRLYGVRGRPAGTSSAPGSIDRPARLDDLQDPPHGESHVVVTYEDDADEDEATSPFARILISASADSDRGHIRRSNDDSLLFLPEHSLFAIADGMGGYAGGQVASELAVEAVKQAFDRDSFVGELRAEKPIPRRGRELASAILQSNWAVFDAARATPALSKMGTTLVAARFSPNKQRVYIGHVGDSRCYRFRAGVLRQLTVDQTMGLIGLRGPRANDLLQAIGATADLSIDLIVDKPHANDVYLLCSDGLSKMASDEEMQTVLQGESDLEAAVYGLIEIANDRGGKDNVSVVLVKVIEQPIRTALPIPSVEMKAKGWSKLPDTNVLEDFGSEDVTIVGSISDNKTADAKTVDAKTANANANANAKAVTPIGAAKAAGDTQAATGTVPPTNGAAHGNARTPRS